MQPYIEFMVPSYALFAVIGFFCMMVMIYFRSEKQGILFSDLLFLYLLLVCGAGCGSKILFILTKVPEMVKVVSWKHVIHIIVTSGFVFYGGLFGAIIGSYIFSKLKKMSFLAISNMITPSFAVFHIWGRIGCFFAGCCYGKVESWGIPLKSEPNVLRIPVQLFESIGIFVILCILLIYEYRMGTRVALLILYLQLYAILRFFLEFFRGDINRGIWFGLSTSQWISLFILVIILMKKLYQVLWLTNSKRL